MSEYEVSTTTAAPAEAVAPVRRRRRRRRRRKPRARRVLLAVALCTLAVGLVWLGVTAWLARGHLNQAQAAVARLQVAVSAGQTDAAQSQQVAFADEARSAHRLTSGPAWWVGAHLPWAGAPLQAVRGIAEQADGLGRATGDISHLATTLDPRALRSADGTIDVAALSASAPAVHRLATAVAAIDAASDALPHHTWLPAVDDARAEFAGRLDTVASAAAAADVMCRVLPTMLGADGTTRHYLVAFENEAELRGTGGLAGAFGILSATGGTISLQQVLSDEVMNHVSISPATAPGLVAAWGQQPFSFFVDGNYSANFPDAGRIWSAYWEQYSGGQTLDGVLAVDPTAVSYLLAATGGGTLSNGQAVTAADVVAYTQRDIYAQYPLYAQNAERDALLVEVAKMVASKALSGSGGVGALVGAMGRAAGEGRLLVWSADPAIQQQFAPHRIAGAIPDSAAPYSQLVVNNAAGGKLDYFLERGVQITRSGCGTERDVDVTITLTNTAPDTGLGDYTEAAPGTGTDTLPPGANRSYVDYVATRGAVLRSATLDGAPTGLTVLSETGGHPVFRSKVSIPAGRTVTLTLYLHEPDDGRPLQTVTQPGVTPVDVEVDDRSCS